MTAEGSPSSTTQVSRGGRGAMVPPAEIRSYYDRPVIKRPVWTWEIPNYFFTGGLAGGAAVLGGIAALTGRRQLATAAGRVALVGTLPSPVLLVADLGRPDRFHHMLRVFKPTSPMSVGSWVLAVFGPAAAGGQVLEELGWFPGLRRLLGVVAGALGPVMAGYTAVLVADTAVPAWHEARRTLPAVFTASAASSAGAATTLLLDPEHAGPARRMAIGGAVAELALTQTMRRRLGELGRPYEEGASGRWTKAAEVLTTLGAGLLLLGGRGPRRRTLRTLGALSALAGSWATRWSVFRAGQASAEDPTATIRPQRERADTLASP